MLEYLIGTRIWPAIALALLATLEAWYRILLSLIEK